MPRRRTWYTVVVGRQPGVYETWADVATNTYGVRGAIQEAHPTAEAAHQSFSKMRKAGRVRAVDGDDAKPAQDCGSDNDEGFSSGDAQDRSSPIRGPSTSAPLPGSNRAKRAHAASPSHPPLASASAPTVGLSTRPRIDNTEVHAPRPSSSQPLPQRPPTRENSVQANIQEDPDTTPTRYTRQPTRENSAQTVVESPTTPRTRAEVRAERMRTIEATRALGLSASAPPGQLSRGDPDGDGRARAPPLAQTRSVPAGGEGASGRERRARVKHETAEEVPASPPRSLHARAEDEGVANTPTTAARRGTVKREDEDVEQAATRPSASSRRSGRARTVKRDSEEGPSRTQSPTSVQKEADEPEESEHVDIAYVMGQRKTPRRPIHHPALSAQPPPSSVSQQPRRTSASPATPRQQRQTPSTPRQPHRPRAPQSTSSSPDTEVTVLGEPRSHPPTRTPSAASSVTEGEYPPATDASRKKAAQVLREREMERKKAAEEAERTVREAEELTQRMWREKRVLRSPARAEPEVREGTAREDHAADVDARANSSPSGPSPAMSVTEYSFPPLTKSESCQAAKEDARANLTMARSQPGSSSARGPLTTVGTKSEARMAMRAQWKGKGKARADDSDSAIDLSTSESSSDESEYQSARSASPSPPDASHDPQGILSPILMSPPGMPSPHVPEPRAGQSQAHHRDTRAAHTASSHASHDEGRIPGAFAATLPRRARPSGGGLYSWLEEMTLSPAGDSGLGLSLFGFAPMQAPDVAYNARLDPRSPLSRSTNVPLNDGR